MENFYDISVKNIEGKSVSMSDYKGKVVLIVNTASECGFTPQYKGLEELYKKYKDKGLLVLGFPSNDFGGQEPGSESEIKAFCESRYQVSFPLFSKVSIKENPSSLYQYLQQKTQVQVAWNFSKFLVSKDGKTIHAFSSKVEPMSSELTKSIEGLL
ncbi:MAG: glutathione peroxidase [Oligoflexia bacterium]|nr:glutathione peroxidase [Oligoflexia bacterium]